MHIRIDLEDYVSEIEDFVEDNKIHFQHLFDDESLSNVPDIYKEETLEIINGLFYDLGYMEALKKLKTLNKNS